MDINRLARVLENENAERIEERWFENLPDIGESVRSLLLSALIVFVLALVVWFGGHQFLHESLRQEPGFWSGITEDTSGNRYIGSGSGAGLVLLFFCFMGIVAVAFGGVMGFLVPFLFLLVRGPAVAKKNPLSTWKEFLRGYFSPISIEEGWDSLQEANGWACILESTRLTIRGGQGGFSTHRQYVLKGMRSLGFEDTQSEDCGEQIVRFSTQLHSGADSSFRGVISGEVGRVGKRWYVAAWQMQGRGLTDSVEPLESVSHDGSGPDSGAPAPPPHFRTLS